MQIIKEEGRAPIKAWVGRRLVKNPTTLQIESPIDIEETALKQLRNMSALPFIHKNGIAVMPDVHAGIGATVGSVIATEKAIIPAAAGVDLGCGMNAIRLSLTAKDLPDSLWNVRNAIEAAVPVGGGKGGDHRKEDKIRANADHLVFNGLLVPKPVQVAARMEVLPEKAAPQLGTLGGGNHFIELCLDEADNVWLMLHSGSRGIGNMIGRHYIERAKRNAEKWFVDRHLPDIDLAYLPEDTQDFQDYMIAVRWAQDYALENRRMMTRAVIEALHNVMPVRFKLTDEAVECHHNYIERENHFEKNLWVTRKGAIRARRGELGIIPGSMGQRSYIVAGKGHPESYCSCSHGAGRVMSRTAAREKFTVEDLVAQTQGVECRKDEAILDEIPASYKDIDQVMANQADLVEIRHTLKAILCVKGS